MLYLKRCRWNNPFSIEEVNQSLPKCLDKWTCLNFLFQLTWMKGKTQAHTLGMNHHSLYKIKKLARLLSHTFLSYNFIYFLSKRTTATPIIKEIEGLCEEWLPFLLFQQTAFQSTIVFLFCIVDKISQTGNENPSKWPSSSRIPDHQSWEY